MTMLNKLVGATEKLKSKIIRKLECLFDVFQCLLLITIIDEFCFVKLTNKRELMRSIISRRHYRTKVQKYMSPDHCRFE